MRSSRRHNLLPEIPHLIQRKRDLQHRIRLADLPFTLFHCRILISSVFNRNGRNRKTFRGIVRRRDPLREGGEEGNGYSRASKGEFGQGKEGKGARNVQR
jgi:hypothetical protein